MMTLNDQIQSFVYSILIGMVFTFIWSFFNRVFYKLKGTFRRLVFEAVLFSMFGVVYYYLLFLINNGVLNIYLPLGLLVGVVIYQLYYAPKLLLSFERLICYIKSKIIKPIKLAFIHLFAIIKKKFKFLIKKLKKLFKVKKQVKKNAKATLQQKKSLDNTKGGDNSLTWNFPVHP
jgi:hypothetical protein